jgi:hypothetical protein
MSYYNNVVTPNASDREFGPMMNVTPTDTFQKRLAYSKQAKRDHSQSGSISPSQEYYYMA